MKFQNARKIENIKNYRIYKYILNFTQKNEQHAQNENLNYYRKYRTCEHYSIGKVNPILKNVKENQ